MGLYSVADEHPRYMWYDRRFKNPGSGGYSSWGAGSRKQSYCVVGNFSMQIAATGAWGWNDQNCTFTYPFICRVRSEWLLGCWGDTGALPGVTLVLLIVGCICSYNYGCSPSSIS